MSLADGASLQRKGCRLIGSAHSNCGGRMGILSAHPSASHGLWIPLSSITQASASTGQGRLARAFRCFEALLTTFSHAPTMVACIHRLAATQQDGIPRRTTQSKRSSSDCAASAHCSYFLERHRRCAIRISAFVMDQVTMASESRELSGSGHHPSHRSDLLCT